MLKAINLSKQVKSSDAELTILNKVSFELEQGQSLAIVGESGSGKTTLLGILAGLDNPSSGEVWLEKQPIFKLTEEQRALLRKNNLGFIFQNFQLIDGLTALENVMMPLELKGDKKAKEQASAMLDKVGLKLRLNHFPNQLSGGEQQRVAIARAFVSKPKLLLADEPTGNLDTKTGQKIIDLMFQLNQLENTTMILVTHDHHLASRCTSSMTMSAGEVIERSTLIDSTVNDTTTKKSQSDQHSEKSGIS